jgi:benzoylformate decarboxylase
MKFSAAIRLCQIKSGKKRGMEDKPNSMKKGKEKLIEQFIADGFRYMFGNPGTVEEGFLDALIKYPELKYITCLHESVAVAMADGFARKSGQLALVQLHSGVGLGNGIGMLYQAFRGHSPLVVIAGDAGIAYDAMDGQMACDLVAMAKPVVKWAAKVVHKDSVLRTVRRAIKIAQTPPRAPVFVSLPLDVLDEYNSEEVFATPQIDVNVSARAETVHGIAKILSKAERPLFIIGDGISFSGGKSGIEMLANAVGAKVYGADSSLVNFDHANRCWQGELGHMFGADSAEKVKDADVVLISGTYVFPEVFPSLQSPFARDAKIIHIDFDSYEIAKNHRVDIAVAANPKLVIDEVFKALENTLSQSERDNIDKRIALMKSVNITVPDTDNLTGCFMKRLAAAVPVDAIIFDESLTASNYIGKYFIKSAGGEFFQTRGGSLGVGIPGAIGIKLCTPEKTVICFTGDGGSMYTIQALYTAARYGIGVKIVILNNHSYQLLKNNLARYWRDRRLEKHDFPDCFSLENHVNYAELSKSMGVAGIRVLNKEDIDLAIGLMLKDDSPFLIELETGNG